MSARDLSLLLACASFAFLSGACGDDAPKQAQLVSPITALKACKYEDCSGHGTCATREGGGPLCHCEEGYAGASCEACELGFHFDAKDECAPDRTCADSLESPCGDHGRCDDRSGVVTCECATGYEGPRCTLCATGYGRDKYGDCLPLVLPDGSSAGGGRIECEDGQCMVGGGSGGSGSGSANGGNAAHGDDNGTSTGEPPDFDAGVVDPCADNPIQAPGQITFDNVDGFPTPNNTCNNVAALTDGKATLRSAGGERVVYTCAPSTIYKLTTDHVMVQSGPEGDSTLSFKGPVRAVSFDYAAVTTLDLELRGDGRLLQRVGAELRTKGTLAFELEKPIEVLTFKGLASSQKIGIDNIRYVPANCD